MIRVTDQTPWHVPVAQPDRQLSQDAVCALCSHSRQNILCYPVRRAGPISRMLCVRVCVFCACFADAGWAMVPICALVSDTHTHTHTHAHTTAQLFTCMQSCACTAIQPKECTSKEEQGSVCAQGFVG